MRLICYWQQRQLVRHLVLGEPIPPGSTLRRHLDQCAACARARRDFAFLHEVLPGSASAPMLSAEFESSLQARLQSSLHAAPRDAVPWRAARVTRLAFAAAVVLMVVLGARTLLHNGRQRVERIATSGELTSRMPLSDHRRKKPVLDVEKRRKNLQGRGSLPLQAILLRDHVGSGAGRSRLTVMYNWPRQSAYRNHGRKRFRFNISADAKVAGILGKRPIRRHINASPALTIARGPVQIHSGHPTWQEVGASYAVVGDYSRAADAYGCALAQQADVDVAMAASQNAERAGDMSQAWEYCAVALRDETSVKNPPESR